MRGSFVTLALLPIAAYAVTQDHLISKRYQLHDGLQKRFVDAQGNTNISILHTNDVHAHLDEFQSGGGDCDPAEDTCYGGYARLKTEIDRQRADRSNDSLLLDAGDQFQGTLFFSTAINGSLIHPVLNEIGYDAACLGNHEFDNGEGLLSDYLSQLEFPMISANVESQTNLSDYLVPYVYFPEQNVAVISVLTPETKTIASPEESTNITEPVEAMQRTVDMVLAANSTARIIALTHIGYDNDIALAQGTRNVHLIVGGHSHTPLGNLTDVETSAGDYPTIETNLDGDEVFVVTAYRWGYALGHIDVVFDSDNKIVAYSGGPITMVNTTMQDESIQQLVNTSRAPFEAYAEEVIGETAIDLSASCRSSECSLGSVMCDALLWYREQTGAQVDGAAVNGGRVRANISAGEITRGDVLTAFPFGNSVVDVEFTGQELVNTLEGIVSGENLETGAEISGFIQVGGMEFSYNPELPTGERMLTLNISGAPVELERTYTIVTIDFVAEGGDSFFEKEFTAVLDTQDVVLLQYIQANSPIEAPTTGRIVISDSTESSISASGDVAASGSASASASSPSASASAAARLARWI